MSIPAITPLVPLGTLSPISSTTLDSTPKISSTDGAQKVGADFSNFLNEALGQVDALQKNADTATVELATGQIQDVSTVMVALQKASLSLSLTTEVRNKAIDAYQEIMRMQM